MTSSACCALHELSNGAVQGGSRSTASRPRPVRGPRSVARVQAPVLGGARGASVDAALSVLLPDRTSLPLLRRPALLCPHVGRGQPRRSPPLPAWDRPPPPHHAGKNPASRRA